MTRHRQMLPQLDGPLFLTDGGIETTLIFHKGIDLPEFATFVLLDDDDGCAALAEYYRTYLDIAAASKSGFVLETPTWRANRDWGAKLGYDRERLAGVNRRAVDFLEHLREDYAGNEQPIVISGNIGPRGDGYVAGEKMTAGEAAAYHRDQVSVFAETSADLVTAMTMTYPEEAVGIVRSANEHGMPSVIGFTTETDGRLPDGTTLEAAIARVDQEADGGPAYYMVNCAHTEHFAGALNDSAAWAQRIRAVRANASRLSHAELDAAEELDDGDPLEFGALHRTLRERLPRLNVFGGCCGTDHRHIRHVQQALYV
ncbi:MAG: homocysteine S-methyltransferase family protein [Woeseiaceae bacterium]|nr:homocysteine S-methyltransferase family protein [Woeseiaceae bacterium]